MYILDSKTDKTAGFYEISYHILNSQNACGFLELEVSAKLLYIDGCPSD